MSAGERVYVTAVTIPCSAHCIGMGHEQVPCVKCQEPFDHRVLLCTVGEFACPQCSRAIVQATKNAEAPGPIGCVFLMFLFALVVCGGLFAPPKTVEPSPPQPVEISK